MVELLTRCDADNDFATNASVLRGGKDPGTGGRYLEELAFEVVNEQAPSHFFKKAQRLSRRGVRRIFAIMVKKGQVVEWSRERESFDFLHSTDTISDPCLRVPLSVKALLDASEADDAVASALLAKGNRTLTRREAGVRQEA